MSLIKEVSSFKQLERAWCAIKKNKTIAIAVDKETLNIFDSNYKRNLQWISHQLKTNKYVFNKVIEKSIPKHNNPKKTRDIRIFTIRDKIVQKSVQFSLEKNSNNGYFPDINNMVSVGFLGGKPGVKIAVERVKEKYNRGYKVLVGTDIANFFDVIDRNKLKKIITKKLSPDNSIDWIIDQCLTPEVVKLDRINREYAPVIDTHAGVSQGSILSPLFSNIYLMDFDKELEKNNIEAIRYADDMAIMSKDMNTSRKDLSKVETLLYKKAGLEFHPIGSEKGPKFYNLKDQGKFLGIQFGIVKNGRWKITPTSKKINEVKQKIDTELDPKSEKNLNQRLSKLNFSIMSWFSGYQAAGCTIRDLKLVFDELTSTYQSQINNLLIKKGLTDKLLSKEKLNFIGMLTVEKTF